jgi:hypothetical protein
MTSKGFFLEQPLEIVQGHARSLWSDCVSAEVEEKSLCDIKRDNVVFGRQCTDSDGVTAAPLSRSSVIVPRAKDGLPSRMLSNNPASPIQDLSRPDVQSAVRR